MRIINDKNPNAKTLSSIAKTLGRFPKGIEKYFKELNIKGTEYKNKIWYSEQEIESLIKYIKSKEKPSEYKYSIYDFKKELNKDYGTIKRCIDYLQIIGFTDIHNKKYFNENEKTILYNFVSKNSNLQQTLAKNTFIKKYNADNPMKNENIKNKNKESYNKQLDMEVSEYESLFNINLISTNELAEKFNRDKTTIPLMMKRLNLNIINLKGFYYVDEKNIPIIKNYFSITNENSTSYSEKEIVNFIKSICDYEILENVRDVISPKELDIYIPSKKLAIEFNGLYWHDENHINKKYHYDKTKLSNDKGIDLIHIFEDDWRDKKDIVKSMISSRLGIYNQKIFARKCIIKEVSKEKAKSFLNENHMQGYASKCNIHLGLFYNEELVQIISITNKGFHDGNTELTRMCSKLNTQIIGGFSKLIKNYCEKYHCNKLVSYVYKSWFNGNGYLKSNFKIIKENPPSYSYILNNCRFHKSNFRKDRLKKMYENKQITYFDENDTESNICFKNKIYKIYDCGTIKVEYNL